MSGKSTQEIRQLEATRKAWEKALQESRGKTVEQVERQYSLRRDEEGLYVFVDVDQHIFEGKTTQEMQVIAKKEILKRFKAKVIGGDYTAYVTKRSAEHYAYPANRRMDEQQKQTR